LLEEITHQGDVLAVVIRADSDPAQTTFLTPATYQIQLGFVVYAEGGEVPRHLHNPVERHLVGTPEVLLIRKGACIMDTYTEDEVLVASTDLGPGDVIMMVSGGHGFRMTRDTVFLEIKQGPFNGPSDKRHF